MNITIKSKGGIGPIEKACIIMGITKKEFYSRSKRKDIFEARVLVAWFYDHFGFNIDEISKRVKRSESNTYRLLREAENRQETDVDFKGRFEQFKKSLTFY